MAVEMEHLSVAYKEAKVYHAEQKQRTNDLFKRYNKPLPPQGNLAASATKLESALAARKRLQEEYWLSLKKARAADLTGISYNNSTRM